MDRGVRDKFSSYPTDIALVLNQIRDLIFCIAEQEGISELEETLKWNEPSYTSKIGSPIRFDYKASHPTQFCIYFNCKTKLIETFKEVYQDTFHYVGNRAIVFELGQPLPLNELSHCLSVALKYKQLRHLNLLGL